MDFIFRSLPIIISNKFKLKHLNSLNADGLIISGGSDVNKNTQRYSTDKMLLNWARKKRKPVLGICYGMQFLSHIDGMKLKKSMDMLKKYIRFNLQVPSNFP